MAYSNYTLQEVVKTFELKFEENNLFPVIKPIPILIYEHIIKRGIRIALPNGSEKKRNELIVMPLLCELSEINNDQISIHSGELLNVDLEKNLNGECDFIVSFSKINSYLEAPIMIMVEAKKQDMTKGIDQCAAQMMGAKIFNQQQGKPTDTIFGCVTTAETWRFIRIKNNVITLDTSAYGINEIDKVLGILQIIVDSYKTKI